MSGAATLTNAPVVDAERLAQRALALLRAARRDAEHAGDGTTIPLHQQDRRCWDPAPIRAALRLIDRAFASPGVGACTLRAAIEAVHAQAPEAASTDWRRIAALYDLLADIDPAPEVQRERAFAHAQRDAVPARKEA